MGGANGDAGDAGRAYVAGLYDGADSRGNSRGSIWRCWRLLEADDATVLIALSSQGKVNGNRIGVCA